MLSCRQDRQVSHTAQQQGQSTAFWDVISDVHYSIAPPPAARRRSAVAGSRLEALCCCRLLSILYIVPLSSAASGRQPLPWCQVVAPCPFGNMILSLSIHVMYPDPVWYSIQTARIRAVRCTRGVLVMFLAHRHLAKKMYAYKVGSARYDVQQSLQPIILSCRVPLPGMYKHPAWRMHALSTHIRSTRSTHDPFMILHDSFMSDTAQDTFFVFNSKKQERRLRLDFLLENGFVLH